ncbi:polymer-forming cytoskeletal protein [Marivibrio halodurans]|uniref:Polymer-forming cytoskeletal protein n=1 Tax=Marivibrio halodurans TaxID=2039722 RepID=A0A8J7RZW1_9PROT|nr:polymer-forming cytoskeletal protein [Marivibrio halodurans]MBP5857335.1 polymer-forming cytoskeletal protein [Marivibrio halodurans]
MTVLGEIVGECDVSLDGRLEGNLRCRKLVIGPSGELIGGAIAQNVHVKGTVKGDIQAVQVTLDSTATVLGNVRHEVLSVAAGARVEGHYTQGLAKPERKVSVDAIRDPQARGLHRPSSKPVFPAGNPPVPVAVGGGSGAKIAASVAKADI